MQFRKDSPSEDLFVLPKLASPGRNNADRGIASGFRGNDPKRLITMRSDPEYSEARSNERASKQNNYDEMKRDIFGSKNQERS